MFDLSSDSSSDAFMRIPLIHPLLIGNEFMSPPIALSEEAQNDYEIICRYAIKQGWICWADFRLHLKNPLHAVVITDPQQTILLASTGFERMTGYTVTFARGKKPKFLQGKDTEAEVRALIREHIQKRIPVEGVLTNYRPDGEPYLCKVQIIPMFNKSYELVNFIALENEVFPNTKS